MTPARSRAGTTDPVRIALVRVGPVPEGVLEHLARFLEQRLNARVRLAGETVDPKPAFDPGRRQYNCRVFLPLLESLGAGGERVLGIADVDLFSPVFTFVFGEAALGGTAAILSLTRIRSSYYGLPEDPGLLLARARTEALHEIGHLLGLRHCRGGECAMRFSAAAEEIDLKPDRLCDECKLHLSETAVSLIDDPDRKIP